MMALLQISLQILFLTGFLGSLVLLASCTRWSKRSPTIARSAPPEVARNIVKVAAALNIGIWFVVGGLIGIEITPLIVCLLPIAASLAPLLAKESVNLVLAAGLSALLVIVFSAVAMFSVGAFYLPSAALLVAAAGMTRWRRVPPVVAPA